MRTVYAGNSSALLCWAPADAVREKAIVEKVDLLRRLNQQPLLSPNAPDAKDMAERVTKWFAVSTRASTKPDRDADLDPIGQGRNCRHPALAGLRERIAATDTLNKAPPSVADRMSKGIQPFMAGLQGIFMTFVVFLDRPRAAAPGYGYWAMMALTLVAIVAMMIGGFVLMAGPEPDCRRRLGQPAVGAGVVTYSLAALRGWAPGFCMRCISCARRGRGLLAHTIVWSGRQRTLDWKSPTSRGEFWDSSCTSW